jgi:hypothetical protein
MAISSYDHYRDSNGVPWTVVHQNHGFTYLATVMDDANPRYTVEVEDQSAELPQGGIQLGPIDILKSDPPTSQQQENLYLELAQKIEQWAHKHAGDVALVVTASPSSNTALWIALALGVFLVASASERRT